MKYLLSAIAALIVLLFCVTIFRNISPGTIFNPDAIIIIFGGTIIAVLIGFPLKRIRQSIADVGDAFRDNRDRDSVVREIMAIARIYRRADIRALEKRLDHIEDGLLRVGVSLLINNHRSEAIRSIMEREITDRLVHLHFSENILKTIARLTPAFGLVGTVIGLIKMFSGVHSLPMITPLMAVALMSTFYGVILSNLVMMPLAAKIRDYAISYEALAALITEGIIATNNGEHPLKIEEGLRGYCRQDESRAAKILAEPALQRGSAEA